MREFAWIAALLIFLVTPSHAQQTNTNAQNTRQLNSPVGHVEQAADEGRKTVGASVNLLACKDLETTATAVDRLYGKDGNPIVSVWLEGTNTSSVAPQSYRTDTVWNRLVDCANQTHNERQRAEALRTAAMWEQWRAEWFRRAYIQAIALPFKSPKCDDLDHLAQRVETAAKEHPESWKNPPGDFQTVLQNLRECAEDSERINDNRKEPEALRARTLMFEWEVLLYNSVAVRYNALAANSNAAEGPASPEWREELANPSSLVLIGVDQRLAGQDISRVTPHNRTLCDQIITVAGLTPSGLALYIPPEGQQFIAKNAEKYPRMCLLQDASKYAPGVPRYLLVWSYSNAAFAGFQPVQRTTTEPISGTGTVTNLAGGPWNFTYTGTETEIETLNAPYVVQSRSLYLRAYDESGNLISQHSITTSRMAGGDASYAYGYNAGALISALWNNPSRLIKSVLNAVQRDSMKQPRER